MAAPTVLMSAPTQTATFYGQSGTAYQAVAGSANILQIDVNGALQAGWSFASRISSSTRTPSMLPDWLPLSISRVPRKAARVTTAS